MRRRRFLTTGATVTTGVLAGCSIPSGGGEDGGGEDGGGEEEGGEDGGGEEEGDENNLTEPK